MSEMRRGDPSRLLALVDESVHDTVLLFGAAPPRGRDLDLLARTREHRTIGDCLRREGLVAQGLRWAAPGNDSVLSVELVLATQWGLPPTELSALFAESQPLPGFRRLAQPAAHHVLLLAARRVGRARGRLDARNRGRVREVLDRDPAAWQRARERAPAWKAGAALEMLRLAYCEASGAPLRWRVRGSAEQALAAARRFAARRVPRRAVASRRRPAVVALSGLDGAGKSLQARSLQESLSRLGIRADVVWPPGSNALFQLNPTVKRYLRALVGMTESAAETGAPQRHRLPVAHGLATLVALAQVHALRRSTRPRRGEVAVIISDRYLLDAIVYVRYRWGAGRSLRFQCLLMERLAPAPVAAFLLEVPAEAAFSRKPDYPLNVLRERAILYRDHAPTLGVRRLDGRRAPEDLAVEIARDVVEQLR